MDIQNYALYITKISFEELNSLNIRGVAVQWKQNENTLHISVYFDRDPTEDEKEDVSDVCGEIIASFSDALMQENYITWEHPKPLPNPAFLAYCRKEK
jgi:DNA-binding ferritin-like protein (Dps family)